MFKYSQGLLPGVMDNLYIQNNEVHSHNTRSSDLLRIPKGTLNFTNISARLWNTLVLNIDVNVSIYTFKYKLKIFLLHNEIQLKYSK